MSEYLPDALKQPVSMLRRYIGDTNDKRTLVAIGGFGNGRGFWVERCIRDYGFEPVWRYDGSPVNTNLIDGGRAFGVFDVSAWKMLPPGRKVVLADDLEFIPPDEKRHTIVVGFPPPDSLERDRYVRANGFDVSLSENGTTYTELDHAMYLQRTSGISLCQTMSDSYRWTAFRERAELPYPAPLMAYYAAYAFPIEDSFWNRLLYFLRYGSAKMAPVLVRELATIWPLGEPKFPDLLRATKKRSAKNSQPSSGRAETMSVPQPMDVPVVKAYDAEW